MGSEFRSAILGPEGTTRSDSGRLVFAPSTPEELKTVVTSSLANAEKLHLLAASARPWGRTRPDSTVAGVSLSRLGTILKIDARNRVASIEAGVSHESLGNALAKERLRWPVEPVGEHESVGATVVSGLALIHSAGLPDLRHWLLGSQWMLGGGTFLGSGGKTIKNSAGYDITRALVGSFGRIAIPVDFQLRLEAIPERRATAEADVAPGIVEAALRKPQEIESIHLSAMEGAHPSAWISISGRDVDVETALESLREFRLRPSEEGGGQRFNLDSLSKCAQSGAIKWTAGPEACERILVQVSRDLPGHAAFAAPLNRWGIASGPDQRRLGDIISENGGRASIWPPTGDQSSAESIPGYREFRRAFDPHSILV